MQAEPVMLRRMSPLADLSPEQAEAEEERPAPHEADDRAYLVLLYQEHAAQARQQEALRAVSAAMATLLIVGLLAYGAMEADASRREWVCGVLVCCVSLLGLLLNQKHSERYELHLSIMRGFRRVLADAVRQNIPRISTTATVQHNRTHRLSRLLIGLPGLWRMVYAAAFLAGAGLIVSGIGVGAIAEVVDAGARASLGHQAAAPVPGPVPENIAPLTNAGPDPEK